MGPVRDKDLGGLGGWCSEAFPEPGLEATMVFSPTIQASQGLDSGESVIFSKASGERIGRLAIGASADDHEDRMSLVTGGAA